MKTLFISMFFLLHNISAMENNVIQMTEQQRIPQKFEQLPEQKSAAEHDVKNIITLLRKSKSIKALNATTEFLQKNSRKNIVDLKIKISEVEDIFPSWQLRYTGASFIASYILTSASFLAVMWDLDSKVDAGYLELGGLVGGAYATIQSAVYVYFAAKNNKEKTDEFEETKTKLLADIDNALGEV